MPMTNDPRSGSGGRIGKAPWLRWLRTASLLARICFSLFAGIMIGVAGSAVYPPLSHLATPLVCDGKMETVGAQYSYKPGQSGVALTEYCVERDGTRKDVTVVVVVLSSLLYATALFLLWPLLRAPLRLVVKRWAKRTGVYAQERLGLSAENTASTIAKVMGEAKVETVHHSNAGAETIARRLQDLARLRDVGLITEQDYESRKREILSEL